MNPDGSGLRRLSRGKDSRDSQPAWSPDGRSIAFVSDYVPGGLYVMDSDGRHVRLLRRLGGQPAWSPDGRSIALTGAIPQVPGISVLNLRSGAVNPISVDEDEHPTWSPDGKHIAFAHDYTGNGTSSIWVMASDGS